MAIYEADISPFEEEFNYNSRIEWRFVVKSTSGLQASDLSPGRGTVFVKAFQAAFLPGQSDRGAQLTFFAQFKSKQPFVSSFQQIQSH